MPLKELMSSGVQNPQKVELNFIICKMFKQTLLYRKIYCQGLDTLFCLIDRVKIKYGRIRLSNLI